MHINKKIGNFGEDLAIKYLIAKKYKIIGRNFSSGHLEIDIIAKIKEKIVFIEVKARTNSAFETADEAVNSRKNNNLNRAVRRYLEKNNITHDNIRLDLIAIDIDKDKKTARIKHYKDIV